MIAGTIRNRIQMMFIGAIARRKVAVVKGCRLIVIYVNVKDIWLAHVITESVSNVRVKVMTLKIVQVSIRERAVTGVAIQRPHDYMIAKYQAPCQ